MSRPWSCKFGDAFRGLRRAVRSQNSFAVHLTVATAVIVAAAVLRVSLVEWCLLVGAIGFVLTAEVFNTAIESLARAHDVGRHPRIRDALDMASAAPARLLGRPELASPEQRDLADLLVLDADWTVTGTLAEALAHQPA